jgi:hypothetical protein
MLFSPRYFFLIEKAEDFQRPIKSLQGYQLQPRPKPHSTSIHLKINITRQRWHPNYGH